MPLPLAHPAAALPLRRFCPRRLSFPALVIGSITPDLGYFLGRFDVEDFAHRPLGIVVFCLPVGLLLTAILFALRARVVEFLPDYQRRLFLPVCQRPRASWAIILISLMIGVLLHIALDGFTHNDGWAVERVSALQTPLFSLAGRTLRVNHLLWYATSFGGVAWLYFVYERWRRMSNNTATAQTNRTILFQSLLVGALCLIVGGMHHWFHGAIGFFAPLFLSALLLAVIALRREPQPRS
jgi:hypothetical protein